MLTTSYHISPLVLILSPLAPKILCKLNMSLIIRRINRRPRPLDRFHEILVRKIRQHKFIPLDIIPRHLDRAFISR